MKDHPGVGQVPSIPLVEGEVRRDGSATKSRSLIDKKMIGTNVNDPLGLLDHLKDPTYS